MKRVRDVMDRVSREAREFTALLKRETDSPPPEIYSEFLIRDVLHATREEVRKMSLYEYLTARNYALSTYVLRAANLGFGGSGGKGGDRVFFPHAPDVEYDPSFVSELSLGGGGDA